MLAMSTATPFNYILIICGKRRESKEEKHFSTTFKVGTAKSLVAHATKSKTDFINMIFGKRYLQYRLGAAPNCLWHKINHIIDIKVM